MAIMLYKLTTGEEVIANQTDFDHDSLTITIEDAVSLVFHQTEKGVSVGFAPFMPQSEGKITIYKSAIAASAIPEDKVQAEHRRIFSGIEIAPAGMILK